MLGQDRDVHPQTLLTAGLPYKHIPEAPAPDCKVTNQPHTGTFVQGEGEAFSAPLAPRAHRSVPGPAAHAPVATASMHRVPTGNAHPGTRAGSRDSLCNQRDKGLSRARAQWTEEAHFTTAAVKALKLAFGATKVLFWLSSFL